MIKQGAKPMGVQTKCGIFRERATPATSTVAQLIEHSQSLIDNLMSRPPPPLEQRKAIYEKTLEEQTLD